jgi:hypothetical protein
MAGRTAARESDGQRPKYWVGREGFGNGGGVGVEVEQASAALHRGGQISGIGQLHIAGDVIGVRG